MARELEKEREREVLESVESKEEYERMEIYGYTCVVGEKIREKKEMKNNIKIRNDKW